MKRHSSLRQQFSKKSAASSAGGKKPFVYSAQYYAQLRMMRANENFVEASASQTVQQQNRHFSKTRAEQASLLREEHIDRIFSSAFAHIAAGPA